MFKKILSLVLVLAMALSVALVVTSCGGVEYGEQVKVLDDVALGAKFEVPDDFKIGFMENKDSL